MIFISIIISLLLLKLYPEYKIYILLFLLLSFILNRRTEGLPNEININGDWPDGVSSDDETNDKNTKIKISDDPVRNCYYKSSPGAPCLSFPSNPENFNQNKDERFSEPEERKPLFFDFLPIWGDSTPYSKDDGTITIQKKIDGNDYKPAHVLSPINVIQSGYPNSDKFTNIGNIAPSGIASPNEKISYRSLAERERRSKIIRDTKIKDENGIIDGKIGVYRGWSGSNDGKIKIEETNLMELDDFVNRINKDNILNGEDFNNFKDCSQCTSDEECAAGATCTNNINDLDDTYTWYADIIRVYANNDGSTGYFLDNLNEPDQYTWTGINDKLDAPFIKIWNDDGTKNDDDSIENEWISKEGVDEDDLRNFNERDKIMFKNIKLKNSPVEKLFDHIRNFEIKNSGKYQARDDSKIIPYKDRRFVYDMISLADRSEVSDIRYEVFQIIERIMTSKSLDNLESAEEVVRESSASPPWQLVKWNPTEPGYNTIDYPSVGSGNIDGVYADSTCTSDIDNYRYFIDPSYPTPEEEGHTLFCSDINKKVTYTPNDYDLGDPGIRHECPNSDDLNNTEDFNRGLYVKCFAKN